MLRAQEIKDELLSDIPIAISGGGGGTAAVLNYNTTFGYYTVTDSISLEELMSIILMLEISMISNGMDFC